MCEYCEKPNKTVVTHTNGVLPFVGSGHLWLRYYDSDCNKTYVSAEAINYCPMRGRELKELK